MRKIYKSILGLAVLLIGAKVNAQVSAYSFTQLNGVYSAVTGGTVFGSAASDDERFVDVSVPAGGFITTGVGIPIGFNFVYNGISFDRFAINNNGWISLGQSTLTPNQVNINSSSSYNALSATSTAPANLQNRIGALAKDLAGQVGSTLRVENIGTTPNQTLVIQWEGYRSYGATGDNFNFQIRLSETTNIVNIVYGTFTTTNISSAQVGLRGTANTDFNNRNVTSPTPWSSSIPGAVNTAVANWNATLTPVSGQNYRWTPPAFCSGAPAATTVVATPTAVCLNGSTTLSLSTSYTTNVNYQWFSAAALAGPYTLIPGATLSFYATTALTTNTFYTAVITCPVGPVSTTATAVQILVNPLPTVSISPSSGTVCSPGTNSVALNAFGAATYSWLPLVGLSSSTGASVNALPSTSTVYTVTGASSAGCVATATTSIIVNPGILMGSVTVNPASICSGANATLNATAISPTLSYCQPAYSSGTGFGDYITNVTVNTMTNVSGPLATPFYTLYPQPAATTTLVAGTAYTVNLQAGTYSLNDLAVWIDYNNNGTLNDLGEKLGEVNDIGAAPTIGIITFTVPLTALNGTARLRVREMDYTGTGIMDPCASQSSFGETEDYLITITGGVNPVVNYSWTPSNFLSSTNTASTVANSANATTLYTVTATSANGCNANGAITLTVNSNPTVTAVSSLSLICNGQTASLTASGASTYSWNTSATTSVVAVSPSVTTSYTVTGTNTNSCSASVVITQSVSACTGLNNNVASTIGTVVYPNPNTGLFTIELNNGSVKTIEVMDLTGRIVLTNTSSNDKIDFNISNLANGVYYVKIQSNNSVEVIKIVKQ